MSFNFSKTLARAWSRSKKNTWIIPSPHFRPSQLVTEKLTGKQIGIRTGIFILKRRQFFWIKFKNVCMDPPGPHHVASFINIDTLCFQPSKSGLMTEVLASLEKSIKIARALIKMISACPSWLDVGNDEDRECIRNNQSVWLSGYVRVGDYTEFSCAYETARLFGTITHRVSSGNIFSSGSQERCWPLKLWLWIKISTFQHPKF